MGRERNSNTKIVNNTDEPIPLFNIDGELWAEVPAYGGKLATFTGAQVKTQREYASRVTFDWRFVKCMENEQKLLELFKNDLKTYYALNILKHFLLQDRNILVKTIKDFDGHEKTVKFTAVDLQSALGVKTRQTASNRIKKLKNMNILKGIKTPDYGYVFAINPDYYLNGSYVPKEIYDLFDITKGK